MIIWLLLIVLLHLSFAPVNAQLFHVLHLAKIISTKAFTACVSLSRLLNIH